MIIFLVRTKKNLVGGNKVWQFCNLNGQAATELKERLSLMAHGELAETAVLRERLVLPFSA